MARASAFVAQERLAQAAFLQDTEPERAGLGGAPYRLRPEDYGLNLAPSIRDEADAYFAQHGITRHTHLAHGLSSQACCLNFLMPLARRPDVLAQLVGRALAIQPPEMLRVEDGPGGDWFIGFEWIGAGNPLGEWPSTGKATRGANVTSTDAVVMFEHDGQPETLLIEWKYTEAYGAPLMNNVRADGKLSGNAKRTARYADKAFVPNGPITPEPQLALDAFFWEPFYQLLRQQMLAWRLEHAPRGYRTRVLHISPRANTALHTVTSPVFQKRSHSDAFKAFESVLAAEADGVPRFRSVYVEDLFGPLLQAAVDDPWATYLLRRYRFLTESSET
ncbi:MAG TPA: hypothetical protein VGL58_09230 [Caulobacteraceae bacterium]|jgi:hypothetical protein